MATDFRHKIGQIGRPTFILALAFHDGLEYQDADGRVNSAMNWSTSCRNLVILGPVTPDITWLICVQQASISTSVSVTAFARWRLASTAAISLAFVFLQFATIVSLLGLFVRERHCCAGRATCKAVPRFLVCQCSSTINVLLGYAVSSTLVLLGLNLQFNCSNSTEHVYSRSQAVTCTE